MFSIKRSLAYLKDLFCDVFIGLPVWLFYRLWRGKEGIKRDLREHYLEGITLGPVSGIDLEEHLDPHHDRKSCDFCRAVAEDPVLANAVEQAYITSPLYR